MNPISAESPVGDLWEGTPGGLTGGRARARLDAAGITTVMDLCARDAADILAIPRTGPGVLAEVRRALAVHGLALAGERAPAPARRDAARKAGETPAAPPRRRKSSGPPLPVTPGEFAVLAGDLRAELDAASPAERAALVSLPRGRVPAAFTGRPWAWSPVGRGRLGELTRYSEATIRARIAGAARDRQAGTVSERTMPPPRPDGTWVIGDLAVWMATRDERRAGLRLSDDDVAQILAVLAAAPRTATGRLGAGVLREVAAQYGVSVQLIKHLAQGRVKTEGRGGPLAAREARRRDELIPAVLEAAQAVRERDGALTYTGLAAEMGVDYRTGVDRAVMAGIVSDLQAESGDDRAVSAFLSARLTRDPVYRSYPVLLAELHEAGVPATGAQVRRLLPGLRSDALRAQRRPAGVARARGESLHPAGLLAQSEVADDWGVRPRTIAEAIADGRLVRADDRMGGRVWLDPARLRARRDGRRSPVDRDHPLAVPIPGDPGYAAPSAEDEEE